VTPKSIKLSIKRLLGLKLTLELVPVVLDFLLKIEDSPPLLSEIAKVMMTVHKSGLRKKITAVIAEDMSSHHSAAGSNILLLFMSLLFVLIGYNKSVAIKYTHIYLSNEGA
jgi:hypothetical protein